MIITSGKIAGEISSHWEQRYSRRREPHVGTEIRRLQRFYRQRYVYTLLINVKFHVVIYVVQVVGQGRQIWKNAMHAFDWRQTTTRITQMCTSIVHCSNSHFNPSIIVVSFQWTHSTVFSWIRAITSKCTGFFLRSSTLNSFKMSFIFVGFSMEIVANEWKIPSALMYN